MMWRSIPGRRILMALSSAGILRPAGLNLAGQGNIQRVNADPVLSVGVVEKQVSAARPRASQRAAPG